jgi:hypothetical protein
VGEHSEVGALEVTTKKCTYARKFHFYCHMRHFFLNIQQKAVIILDFLRLSAMGREVLAVMGLDIKLV